MFRELERRQCRRHSSGRGTTQTLKFVSFNQMAANIRISPPMNPALRGSSATIVTPVFTSHCSRCMIMITCLARHHTHYQHHHSSSPSRESGQLIQSHSFLVSLTVSEFSKHCVEESLGVTFPFFDPRAYKPTVR